MSVAKLHVVKKAMKDQGKCERCATVVTKGMPYQWYILGFRSNHKRVRCMDHTPRPSERESSLRSNVYAAQEAFEDTVADGIEDIEGLNAAFQEFVEAVREYADDRRYALDEWPNGNSTLEEYAEEAEEALNGVEDFEAEEFDADELDEDDEDYEDQLSEQDEARAAHLEEKIEEASELVSGISV